MIRLKFCKKKAEDFSLLEPPNAILHRFLSRFAGYSYSHDPEMRAFSLISPLQNVTFSSNFMATCGSWGQLAMVDGELQIPSKIFGYLEQIYYFCGMNEDVRETFHSAEYDEYYASLDAKTKVKYDYVETLIKTQYVVNKKFVKNLEGTEFYEARISVGTNEHRTIVFAVDSLSFMESKQVLFLNSFLKKNTKQYKGEIETARQILNKYIQGGQEDDKA